MRRYSTRESTNEGEVSALAILETLLAAGLLLGISLHYDTSRWLAVAVCLAPLTLLRTEDSVQRGLRWKKRLDVEERFGWLGGPPAIIVWSLEIAIVWHNYGMGWGLSAIPLGFPPALAGGAAIAYFCIRFGATLISVFKHPLLSLGAVPQNWQRIVLATDSATDPEFLPGDDEGPGSAFAEFRNRTQPWAWRIVVLLAGPPIYVLTASYRWSVKATCLIYLPLIWLVRKGQYTPANVRDALDEHQADDLQRVRLVVGLLLLTLFAMKAAFMVAVNGFAEWWDRTEGLARLKILVVPHEIPLWQVASALNCLLALWLWRYARQQLRRYQRQPAPDDAKVLKVWRAMTLTSALLSLYTIACTVTIVVKAGVLWPTIKAIWETTGKKLWP